MNFSGVLARLRRPPTESHPHGVPPVTSHEDALAGSEMSFIDHLEDLRWALIKGLAGVAVFVFIAVFFARDLVDTVLLAPKDPDFWTYRVLGIEAKDFALQNRTISGQFFAYIGTVFAAGLALGAPWLIYQIWKFVAPGLYPQERQSLRGAAWGGVVFLLLGTLFGYFFLVPLSLQFFAGFQLSPDIENQFDITKYFGMITLWSLGTGVLFELPVVLYALARLGVVTAPMLQKGRRLAIVVILIVAAFLTPPDPFSQVIVAMPLYALYELSILLARRVGRIRAQAEAEEAARLAAEEAAAPAPLPPGPLPQGPPMTGPNPRL